MKTVFRLFLVTTLLFATGALWAGASTEDTTPDVATDRGVFGEAPMLAALVASGDLPAVEDRLPDEPYVHQVPEVGNYGGTLTTFTATSNSWGDLSEAPDYSQMIRVLEDGSIIGDIAKDFQWSNDGKTLTFFLREGMKWSDGSPVTTEDIIFAHFSIHEHEAVGAWGTSTGDAETITAIDDLTLQLDYAVAYESTILRFHGYAASEWGMIMPSNYYKSFHIDFNEDADDLAIEAGYESWNDRLSASLPFTGTQQDLDRPTLFPFRMISTGNDVRLFERNPYFHSIDQAGNQLPYIDDIVVQNVDIETYHLKIASGEMDLGYYDTNLENFTLYKENEQSGNYTVTLIPGIAGNENAFRFNLLSTDDVKGPILADKRFRQALSLAINRAEINDILYQGVAVPRQVWVDEGVSWYDSDWDEYTSYDPSAANALLDQMGLTERGSNGFRLSSGGQSFTMIMEHNAPDDKLYFLVEEYWEDVGIETQIVFEERTLWRARRQDGLYDIMAEGGGVLDETMNWTRKESLGISVLYWQPWSNWLDADWNINVDKNETLEADYDGVMPGLEPPDWVKRVRELKKLAERAPFGSSAYIAAQREFYDIHSDQMMVVGTVGKAPTVSISRPNLRNVSDVYAPLSEYPGSLNYFLLQIFYD